MIQTSKILPLSSIISIRIRLGGGSSLPTGLSLGWSHAAQGPKFKIPLPRSIVHRPVEYACQVSSTLAQWSWSLRVLNMLTPHGRTYGRTSDRFYQSSRERRLKLINHYHNMSHISLIAVSPSISCS